MTRKTKAERASGYTILLVDDNPEYLEATGLLLEREGHHVICAEDGPEALRLLRQAAVDLLLLDYFMPGMNGEEVVTHLRQFNPYVQVILQTGYASERPPRELLQRLDIQGYYDKSEGPDKLLLWVDVGLKVAYTVQLLYKSRQGLRYILDVTPDLHKIQPLEDLLQGILWQVSGLLGSADSFLAVLPGQPGSDGAPLEPAEGFLAMIENDADLVIHASTGHFAGQHKVAGSVLSSQLETIRQALQQGEIKIAEQATIVPLRVGGLTMGVIYLDRPCLERDIELLQIFANQAAVAIHNTQLYEMATLDPLTGVYVRRFFVQWLLRELRSAFRSAQPLSLLLIDLDGMKHINDTAGHLAGDQALATVGRVLRQATRTSDIVGRYGGDEFMAILTQTGREGAESVAQRILSALQETSVTGPSGPLPLEVSLGIGVLGSPTFAPADIPRPLSQRYFQEMAQFLIQGADQMLYEAKRSGGNCAQPALVIQWQTLSKTAGDPPGASDPPDFDVLLR